MVAAVGVRPHSGWAVMATVTRPDAPEVLRRERVELCPERLPRQVYHDVGERKLGRAPALRRVEQVQEAVTTTSRAALQQVAADFDFDIGAVAVVGAARDMPPFDAIMRSHPLWHAAEGQM